MSQALPLKIQSLLSLSSAFPRSGQDKTQVELITQQVGQAEWLAVMIVGVDPGAPLASCVAMAFAFLSLHSPLLLPLLLPLLQK